MSHPVAPRTSWYNETMRSSLIRRVKRLVKKMYWALGYWRSGAHNPNVTGWAGTTRMESWGRAKTPRIGPTGRAAALGTALPAGRKAPGVGTESPPKRPIGEV